MEGIRERHVMEDPGRVWIHTRTRQEITPMRLEGYQLLPTQL